MSNIIYFLIILTLINSYFILNSSLDWDSSNHLYNAKLKKKKRLFYSSYRFGLKIFLPYFYSLIWPFIKKNLKFYRVLNLIIFYSTFLLITKNLDYQEDIVLILFIFICFNISLFNPQTSATEFISTLFIILLIDIHYSYSLPFYLIFFIIVVTSLFFKINEISYLLPFFLDKGFENILNINSIIFSLIVLSLIFLLNKKKLFFAIKKYSRTRTLIRPVKFFFKNFIVITAIYIWSIYIFLNGDEFVKSIFIILYLNYFFQKNLMSYFIYPLIIFNLYFSINLDLIDFSNIYFQFLFLIFLINFSLGFIINLIFKDFEVTYRIFNNFDLNRPKELKSEKEYFAFMKNTNPKDNVFLWGHRMILLLKIENDQLFDNYYSIMQEKYYFNNKNLLDNTLNYIKLKKPKIIVEYDPGSILGKIPSSLYLEYQKVFSSGNINVLKRLK